MPAKHIYQFGEFRIDPQERLLIRDGNPIPLTPKAFETLLALVENSGHVVKKDDLMKRVWPDAFVEEVNLAQNVSVIRRVLDSDGEQYIETVPKLGYRLIVKATAIGEPEQSAEVSPTSPIAVAEKARVAASPNEPRDKKRSMAVGLAALLVIASIGVIWVLRTRTARAAPVRISSLAVLPLENLSKDPEQEYFADGMTDALITDLAKIHALRVISRTSVMRYKGRRPSVSDLARDLNVDAIVEGTVMRAGDRVRITAQLIEAPRDRHLWADSYERDLRDVVALQDDVAKAIAGEIKVTLTAPEETRLSSARPVDPAAQEAYLRGTYELHGMAVKPTPELKEQAVNKAAEYFEQAIRLDPNNALTYAALAETYSSMITIHRAPMDVMPKAKAAAMRAVELDDNLAEAHASLGYMALTYDWDWPRSEREFRRALELNPSLPQAHLGYGKYLFFIPRRTDEAIQEWRRAYALDPLLPSSTGDLAWFLFLARRYNESIEEARKMPEPDYHTLALDYAELGRTEEAVAAADRSLATMQEPIRRSQVVAAYAIAGRKDKARAQLDSIINFGRLRYLCGFNVGSLFAVLGEKEQAYSWLEKAYRDRSD